MNMDEDVKQFIKRVVAAAVDNKVMKALVMQQFTISPKDAERIVKEVLP